MHYSSQNKNQIKFIYIWQPGPTFILSKFIGPKILIVLGYSLIGVFNSKTTSYNYDMSKAISKAKVKYSPLKSIATLNLARMFSN